MSDHKKYIRIRGAKENNLKGLSVNIPRDEFVVLTGLSGSGKSSLAFDTIYAEGQRRYMESLSSYARMFLGQMEKPDVESIEGLPPAISIDQKSTNRNPRSTVGTVTEIYDHLRLLYARIGTPHCPKCGREIKRQTVDQIVDALMSLPTGTRYQLLAPMVRGRKGEHAKVLESAKRSGYVRVRVDGSVYDLSEEIKLDKNVKHSIEIIVDRLSAKEGLETRLTDSVETALRLGEGLLMVDVIGAKSAGAKADGVMPAEQKGGAVAGTAGEMLTFSQNFACPDCGISIEELEPRSFSFNNPFGACPACNGLGYTMEFSERKIVPDPSLSINRGALAAPGFQSSDNRTSFAWAYLNGLAEAYGFSLDTPYEKLSDNARKVLMYGDPGHSVKVHYMSRRGQGVYDIPAEGVIRNLQQRYRETASETMRQEYESFMDICPCKECGGLRLRKEALAVTVGDRNIAEVCDMPIRTLRDFVDNLELTPQKAQIAKLIMREIRSRVGFLVEVGLDYLTLSRPTASLSGGEAQRIRLATQIGSGLVGVAYILDEPSIGLHQRDNDRLLRSLKQLRDLGNTLIVVEHDEDTMRAADWVIDIGPGAGQHGGEVVAEGTAEDIMACPKSITGDYLAGRRFVPVPAKRRTPSGWLTIRGAREHNLKNIDVKVPLGVFTCVTGVSGSGKSSLINEILYKSLARKLNRATTVLPGDHDAIEGTEALDKVIDIDQSPIGRTPRSNPATYTGVFDQIRDLFASTTEAKLRGYTKGRFSFNVKGGRCEACKGDGIVKIEMNFLPDVYVPCEVCGGKRYNRETLEATYKGKSIYDVLDMRVEEAVKYFENIPSIGNKIKTLDAVGLSYLKLGHPSTSLSGGEAQRIKLATELSRRSTGKTIYILDEPTTGLHFADVQKLIDILHMLAEGGNTVVVIEHNLDVIKTADYIIDMGPEGGDGGGTVIASGTPEEICNHAGSYTGQYLKPCLQRRTGATPEKES